MVINLHSIAFRRTRVINGVKTATIWRNQGYTTLPSGKREPLWERIASGEMDVQSASDSDLRHLEGLNIQGEHRAVYLQAEMMAVVRPKEKGGDLLVFSPGTYPEGDIWLATCVLEDWPGWRKVAITLQRDDVELPPEARP